MKRMNAGFTLLEVMLGVGILAMIGTFTAQSWRASILTEQLIREKKGLQETGTSAILKIRDDLTQTFYVEAPLNKREQNLNRQITYFKGEDSFGKDRLEFTSFSHYPSTPDANEGDQAEITYEVEDDPKAPGTMLLKRRESRYVDLNREEGGDFSVLASGVTNFNVEYFDGEKYVPQWDAWINTPTTRLPKLVRVELVIRDKKGREEKFETIVDLPMAESLNLAQTGTPKPPGGTGGESSGTASPRSRGGNNPGTSQGFSNPAGQRPFGGVPR